MLNVALILGLFVECKIGVMYVGRIEALFMYVCLSQDGINIREILHL